MVVCSFFLCIGILTEIHIARVFERERVETISIIFDVMSSQVIDSNRLPNAPLSLIQKVLGADNYSELS